MLAFTQLFAFAPYNGTFGEVNWVKLKNARKKDLNKRIKIMFMNSKNFFAISKLKIIIFFLFVVLFFLVLLSPILNSDKGITMIISPAMMFSFIPHSSGYWLTGVILFFVIDVVYWFLLACLIDWIYNNFGKK
jgi:hypothetical protein